MELDLPTADGFMRVSDMRGDIVITQKPQDRVRDYDEIGFVRVAKFLKLPRMDFWKNDNGLVQTKRKDGVWYVAINDQDLADKIAHEAGDNRKFDERFVNAFRSEVRTGLASCLRQEKLLNAGKYNWGFFVGYAGGVKYNLLGALFMVEAVLHRDPALAGVGVMLIGASDVLWNSVNLLAAGIDYVQQKYLIRSEFFPTIYPTFNDPFVKNSLFDLIMPPVPIDRLIRGSYVFKTTWK